MIRVFFSCNFTTVYRKVSLHHQGEIGKNYVLNGTCRYVLEDCDWPLLAHPDDSCDRLFFDSWVPLRFNDMYHVCFRQSETTWGLVINTWS